MAEERYKRPPIPGPRKPRNGVAEMFGGNGFDQRPYLESMAAIMEALQYPVAKDGSVLGISDALNWMKPTLAYHLARCGIGPVNPPLIKKQRVDAPMIEDACKWVGINAPDDPLADVENMTMAQINSLPEDLAVAAKRRLGILPPPEPSPGWVQPPVVTIADGPEGPER